MGSIEESGEKKDEIPTIDSLHKYQGKRAIRVKDRVVSGATMSISWAKPVMTTLLTFEL